MKNNIAAILLVSISLPSFSQSAPLTLSKDEIVLCANLFSRVIYAKKTPGLFPENYYNAAITLMPKFYLESARLHGSKEAAEKYYSNTAHMYDTELKNHPHEKIINAINGCIYKGEKLFFNNNKF